MKYKLVIVKQEILKLMVHKTQDLLVVNLIANCMSLVDRVENYLLDIRCIESTFDWACVLGQLVSFINKDINETVYPFDLCMSQ